MSRAGGPSLFLVPGDLVWWGKQGGKPSDNPYWKLVNEDVLKQLPAPDDQMRAAGLPGRVFPAVGNHEVWDDSDVQGLLSSFPYLKNSGFRQTTHLQVRLQRRPLHLPMDRPIRLSRATGWSATAPRTKNR